MKAEKKITIKVKSKAERRIMADPEVEMISEWNIKRILSAALVFFIVIIIPAYYFSHLDDDDTVKSVKSPPLINESNITQPGSIKETITPVSEKVVILEEAPADAPIAQVPTVKPSEQADNEVNAEAIVEKEVQQQQASQQPSETEYLNPHITHAQLALGMNKLKPYGEVEFPLLVDNTKARGLFFFTEVNNMRGSTVFHEWLMEGKSIYKLKAIIRSNNSGFYTSKLFTPSSVGQWQVRIITNQGEVLHKIDFSVENR